MSVKEVAARTHQDCYEHVHHLDFDAAREFPAVLEKKVLERHVEIDMVMQI